MTAVDAHGKQYSLSLRLLVFSFSALVFDMAPVMADDIIFRMRCGEAGTVTAKIKRFDGGTGPYMTDVYSDGLNVGAKNLKGMTGASHFIIEDKGYSYRYFSGDYTFSRYGKNYKCKPIHRSE